MQILLPSLVVLFDLILPIGLLLWAFGSRARSRIYLASIFVLTAVVLVALAWSIFGFWHAVGLFWPIAYLIAFAAIVIYRLARGVPQTWFPKMWGWEFVLTGINILHAATWALLIPPLLQARSYEGIALDLSPPLRGGSFYVLTGGANISVNQHPDYAMDIGKLNALGLSAFGLFPKELEKYPALNIEVIAPCSGEVIAVENTQPNRLPLDPDGEDRRGGNHVVIFCEGHSVHLAHMQAGSIVVGVGDRVVVGQFLGKVGNSGNTMQPHLHINAARGRRIFERGERRAPTAEAVPFLIEGRFLIKGDSFAN